jgi:tRNA (cmo5U34)-methyltransferase
MPENRYHKLLRDGNQEILKLHPSNQVLRVELSFEIKKIIGNNWDVNILEFGIGEGDLTKYVLSNNPKITIDCLDISKEMLEVAKNNLTGFIDRTKFICGDVLDYLTKTTQKYDIIISAWTIHNFTWKEKKKVLEAIFDSLPENGKFLIMEKIFPDDEAERTRQFEYHIKRYDYLEPNLRRAIVEHEKQDLGEDFRMDESSTIKTLNEIGFKKVRIIDRVERDVLLIAEK